MRILQVTAAYKPAYVYGGPTMSVAKLSEEIAKSDCQVEVFTTTANGTAELDVRVNERQDVEGVPVRYFRRITKDHSHFSPALLFAVWKEIRTFDVLHIHAWWNLVSVFSCMIALWRKVPVVVSPRGTLSNYSFTNNHVGFKKILHTLIGKPLLNRCYLHITAESEQQAMEELLHPKGLFMISNFVSLPPVMKIKASALVIDSTLATNSSIETNSNNKNASAVVTDTEGPVKNKPVLNLLFLSRIDQKKGLELLFEALATINIPYHLSIAGTGAASYIEQLKQLSMTYQIDHHIDWLGFKSEADGKFELIAAHDLLVLPSYDENFANVVIESLAMGTAVLLSEKVGLAAYTAGKQLGWICQTNADSVRASLLTIANDRAALTEIRQRAPGRIETDFSDTRLIKEYLEMYKTVIK